LGRKRKRKKRICLHYNQPTSSPANDRLYVWARGLDSGFDVPHATNNVSNVTEGSGVGVLKEPPVNVGVVSTDNYSYNKCVDSLASEAQRASNLCFVIRVAERLEVVWETIYVGQKLFVEVPNALLPEGSKESLVTLLEYAEEELDCTHVILCFKKARLDRANLIRTFMFLGFKLVTPGDPMVPNAEDLMFLVYAIDNYDSD
jgi:hypothetical protein